MPSKLRSSSPTAGWRSRLRPLWWNLTLCEAQCWRNSSLWVESSSAGIAGVATEDAGAASGMVNTFHQLGMALGLGVLITASAHSGWGLSSARAVLAAQVDTAPATGSVLLLLCLITAVTLILPADRRGRQRAAEPARSAAGLPTSPAGSNATSLSPRAAGTLVTAAD